MPQRNDDPRGRDRDWSRRGPDYEWVGHEGEFRNPDDRASSTRERQVMPNEPRHPLAPTPEDPRARPAYDRDDEPIWRGRYFGRGPKGYRRSDERIQEEISDRLMMHPDVDASDVEVHVTEGIVTLSGTIEDRHQKRIAELVAEDALGVDDVRNQIEVRRGFWSSLGGGGASDRDVPRAHE